MIAASEWSSIAAELKGIKDGVVSHLKIPFKKDWVTGDCIHGDYEFREQPDRN
jgi:hypothetical protein